MVQVIKIGITVKQANRLWPVQIGLAFDVTSWVALRASRLHSCYCSGPRGFSMVWFHLEIWLWLECLHWNYVVCNSCFLFFCYSLAGKDPLNLHHVVKLSRSLSNFAFVTPPLHPRVWVLVLWSFVPCQREPWDAVPQVYSLYSTFMVC